MDCNMFEEEKKAAQREKQFPIDLENAYQLGQRLIQKAMENHGKKGSDAGWGRLKSGAGWISLDFVERV
jgi:hypothetical protein